MRLLVAVLCLGLAATLAGCVETPPGSLYPMYSSDKDVAMDPSLVGEWRDNSDPSHPGKWFFRGGDEPGVYLLGIVSADDRSTCKTRLVRSESLLFLDVLPLDSSWNDNAEASGLRVSLHAFFRLEKEGDRLRLSYLSPDWYQQQLELKQFPLTVERLGDDVPVITSPSEEVRAFYTRAAAAPEAFVEIVTLRRYQAPAGR